MAFKYYNFNEGSNKFYKTNFLTLNHCEVMGIVLDINNYLKNGRWELQSGKKRAKIDSETSSSKLLVENDTQTITQMKNKMITEACEWHSCMNTSLMKILLMVL